MRNDRLREIAAKVFRVTTDRLSAETAVGSIEAWDSLTHLELIFRLEEAFGVRFEMQRIAEMRSLGEIETELEGMAGAGTRPSEA